jgi:thiamine-monophosphate kinase
VKKEPIKSLFDDITSLSEIGEFGLIERVAQLFREGNEDNGLGIGDDCAVLPLKNKTSLLVTTDMLIENRHFRMDWIDPEDLGYKALAVNISDISAMGGIPEYAFLSLGLNSDISTEWLDRFFRGTRELSEFYDIKLMGGDTTKSPADMVISYTLLGRMDQGKVLLRSGARPGDKIALLGKVGESGAGLKLLAEKELNGNSKYQSLVKAHNRPNLFVREAQYLAEFDAVHSMIDLSDGIQSDARHIANRSGAELIIDLDLLPLSSTLTDFCKEYSCSAIELALTSGEDYGLLFTMSGDEAGSILNQFIDQFGYSFHLIGEVAEGSPAVNYIKEGRPLNIDKHGFDHFKTK